MAEYTNTYDAVISIANSLMAEGKYDSTYSAVLAIYQSLTADDTTKFDSTYSIVTTIANGLEDGSISIGGGDISLTTLTKSINKNGEYSYTAESGTAYKKVNISVNVPAEAPIPLTHKFYDLNGELVEEWTLEETQSKTSLPTLANIPMDGWTLNFDGWNWDLDKIKSATCSQNIGALYKPSDNKTHITVNITEDNLNCGLFILRTHSSFDTFVIDWGDGSVESFTNNTIPIHTYSIAGIYDIKVEGTFYFQGTDATISDGFNVKYMLRQITNIYIANELDQINIRHAANLQRITFPNVINPIIANSTTYLSFQYLYSLKYITIPKLIETSYASYPHFSYSGLEIISNPHFLYQSPKITNCNSLTSINIPDGITSLSNKWEYVNSLNEIYLPDSVTSVSEQVIMKYLGGEYGRTTFKFYWNRFTEFWNGNNLSNQNWEVYVNGVLLEGADIIPTTWSNAGTLLQNKLGKLIINENCTIAGYKYVFNDIKWASELIITKPITVFDKYLVIDSSYIKKVTLPNTITECTGNFANNCPNIEEFTYPPLLTNINASYGSFYRCTQLETIDFGNINLIPDICCQQNYKLKNVIIPETVTSIGRSAFDYCQSLSYIKLPKAVTTIGITAFGSTAALTIDMSDFESVPTLSSTNGIYPSNTILVPSSLYDEWIAATNWSALSSQIVAV